jgi:aspartate racemase
MKTIGMLGGMSWESTATYYQLINDGVKSQLGGLHSAKMVLHSVDFAEIELLQRQADWPAMATLLGGAAKKLQSAGADFFMICAKVDIPLLHIADTTAVQLIEDNVGRVGLLGTRFTMDDGFYQSHLFDKYGIEVLVPEEAQKASVHEIIYRELCQGQFLEASRKVYLDVIERLVQQGAQAVILGCTEIALLIQQTHTQIPLYDTTDIHARAAVSLILDNNE